MIKDTGDLPGQAVIQHLKQRSDLKGLTQLGGHLGALLITGMALGHAWNGVLMIPALIAYSIVLTFLFAPLHETIHFTAFRTRWLNNLVAGGTGFLLLLPYQYFRSFHYAHHRHTQDPQRDPELIARKPWTRLSLLLHVSGLPLW